jgi:acetoin utilization protein AcuB
MNVHGIMTRKPITLLADATLTPAVNMLLAIRISCIPIVDAEFRPVGILSWRYILRALQTAGELHDSPPAEDNAAAARKSP